MFEVGFSELCMVGLVALLVIGPEKLPKLARLAGFWLGKTRTMVATVKAEIKEELRAEEMRQIFKEQQTQLSDFEEALHTATEKMQASLQEVEAMSDEPIKPPHEKTP